jgi:SPP1 gp7 family putative phage head morphogenesis protein
LKKSSRLAVRLHNADGKEIALKAIRPNIGIAAAYRRKLLLLVNEMATSYAHWIRAQYRRQPPEMAQDASPARELGQEIKKLGKRWDRRINDLAPQLARWFAKSAGSRSEAGLKKMLRDAGFTVKFQMTAAMRDVIDATIAENVALIKSIGSEYHSQVEGLVMRSVTAGGDLEQLSKDLRHRYGVTRRRAELIARDQNRKATASLRRARETELGIEDGIWLHSHGGNEPRPTHVKQDGKRFNLKTGWFDTDPKVRKHILPGELINCRCTWKPVIKGFS